MKEKINLFLDRVIILSPVLYFIMAIVQMAAIQEGIIVLCGWHWAIAMLISIPIAFIPLVGSVAAIMGMLQGFGWSLPATLAIFGWQYLFYFIFINNNFCL